MHSQQARGTQMHKLLRPLFALLPVCGIGFFAAAGPVLPHSATPPRALEDPQRRPASLNKTRRIILAAQDRFYQQSRSRPDLAARAAALYNQCADDTSPSALRGNDLPMHLP